MEHGSTEVRRHLRRGLERLRETTGLPVALGGLARPDGKAFRITELSGTLTRSLAELEIAIGHGLGGRAFQLRRPASVGDYVAARGITHRYDHHVTPEKLRSLASVPVALPGRSPLAMLYVGSRSVSSLGDRTIALLKPIALDLARDLSIEEEIGRRMRQLVGVTRRRDHAELRELRSALRTIMEETEDVRTRSALERLIGVVETATDADRRPTVHLTPRERQVLRLAGEGLSNADIGVELGLATQTIKAYVRSAMGKLDARNRVQAARAAQIAEAAVRR